MRNLHVSITFDNHPTCHTQNISSVRSRWGVIPLELFVVKLQPPAQSLDRHNRSMALCLPDKLKRPGQN